MAIVEDTTRRLSPYGERLTFVAFAKFRFVHVIPYGIQPSLSTYPYRGNPAPYQQL